MCAAFLQYLNILRKNSVLFYKILNSAFGEELCDDQFLKFLARKLHINPVYLRSRLENWIQRDFTETRGRKSLRKDQQQKIYDLWLNHSIPSVDTRNDRDSVKMAKEKYDRRYKDIEDQQLKEARNKKGSIVCQASCRVATSTVRGMQSKVKEKLGINISYGLTLILKPFYVIKPTDKEKAMCLCKFCLNIRLQFNALMANSKKANGPVYDSITKFFMDTCYVMLCILYWQ